MGFFNPTNGIENWNVGIEVFLHQIKGNEVIVQPIIFIICKKEKNKKLRMIRVYLENGAHGLHGHGGERRKRSVRSQSLKPLKY